MKLKYTYILLFALVTSGSLHAQLNQYKYIVIPKKFDAFTSENKYLTSTLVKYYFTQYGFNTVYDDDKPTELAENPCLGLEADILDFPSLFSIKTVIVLNDCYGEEIFRTIEGKSKEKEYRVAYREALEESFVSFTGMDYKYVPKEEQTKKAENNETITVSFRDDVKSVENRPNPKVIQQKATTEEQLYQSKEPVSSNMVKADSVQEDNQLEKAEPSSGDLTNTDTLVAQAVENGYHLLDSSSNVVLKLQETSIQDIFLTNYKGNSAVLLNKDGQWMLEYAENGEKQIKELNISF